MSIYVKIWIYIIIYNKLYEEDKNEFKKVLPKVVLAIFITVILTQIQFSNVKGSTNFDNSSTYNQELYNQFVPGQVIVSIKDEYEASVESVSTFSDIDISSVENLTKAKSPKNIASVNSINKNKILLIKLKSKDKIDVLDAINKLKSNPKVEYAEPDYEIELNNTNPNDPYFNELYGMNKINAPQAWDTFTGSNSVVVGVIDTGIDYNHPDLAQNIWTNDGEIPSNGIDDDGNGYIDDVHGYDFVNNDGDPMDDYNHGTHCAGILAGVGNNTIGVTGVCWQVKLAALKWAGSKGEGFVSDAIRAIDYANKMGFPITSNSWSTIYNVQALKDTIAAGGLFVAAAGNNDGNNNDINAIYPASYDCANIISVAATDINDNLASFSNYGYNSVDIAAPGVNILSCKPNNSYQFMNGTSMATPHVAGAAALLKGFNPNLSALEIKNMILSNVDKLPQLSNMISSGGRLNVANIIKNPFPPRSVFIHSNSTDSNETHRDTIINYRTWDGNNWTAKLDYDGKTFIHAPNGDWSQSYKDTVLCYKSWDGSNWSVKMDVDGVTFIHAPNGDWSQAHKDNIITYQSWGGGKWSARIDGFVHTKIDNSESHKDTIINYISWDGSKWSAKLDVDGTTFVHAPNGDWSKSHKDTTISYITLDGSKWSAKLDVDGVTFIHALNGDWNQTHNDINLTYKCWDGSYWTTKKN